MKNPPVLNIPPKLHPLVVDLHEKLDKKIELDPKTGAPNDLKTLWAENLTGNLTTDLYKELQDYNTAFATAAGWTIGEKSVPVMSKNPNVDRVQAIFPMVGKDVMSATFSRSTNVPAKDASGNNTTRESYGTLSIKFDHYAGKPHGDLNKIKDMLSAAAAKAFSGK